jgi:hypothetical protein
MGLKDEINKAVDDVADTIDEAGHRTNAAAERMSREAAGDDQTPVEKAGSVLNEGKERVLADVDRAKRDARNSA